jgi:hypothetical protein
MPRRGLLLSEIAAVIAFALSIVVVLLFLAADTPEEAALRGWFPLPAACEAGVLNHGAYLCWFTIREHPLWFALSIACLVASSVVLARVQKTGGPQP